MDKGETALNPGTNTVAFNELLLGKDSRRQIKTSEVNGALTDSVGVTSTLLPLFLVG